MTLAHTISRPKLAQRGAAALVWAVAALGSAPAMAQGAAVQTGHVKAELVAQTTAATPGRQIYVALHQSIAPGWHTYWRNPGDAGQSTTIAWTLPQGWTAGPIVWPAPERFLAGPIMNYVYTDAVDLPVQLSAPANARPGQTVSLRAVANWLVCKDVCIPETANLSLELPVVAAGPAPMNPQGGAAVAHAVAAAPKPGGLAARFQPAGGTVKLFVAGAALKGLDTTHAYFYPYDGMALEQASPQRVARGAGGLTLILPAGYGFSHGKPPERLEGVLSLAGKAFEVSASPGALPPGAVGVAAAVESTPPTEAAAPQDATSQAAPATSPTSQAGLGLAAALGLAFVGGLVLNLMPCVFPVLSIKAAALARHLESPAQARGEGLAFLLGVVGSFVALAAMLILARAAGQAVGWGFQLQSPIVVGALALVMLAAGLNLSGVFEAGLSLQGVGAQTAARHQGWIGSALTGVLAVVVAAPCTAPFMAPAIGWALVQPPGVALAVFVALGLGLAAPFTAVSFTPRLFGRLPKPGAWMEGLRKVLAFPMYGAAAWLAWVYTEQAGAEGLPRLFAAALAAAFAAFCWGVAQRARRPLTPRAAAVAAIAAAIAALAGAVAAPAATASAGAALSGAPGPASPQPWSASRVATLRAQGHPVFVDFTAAWCVTCQVNERTTLATHEVADAFARTGAVYLKADWTRPDPAINAALTGQGRSGVPLYLVYAPTRPTPAILPQVLTPAAVISALTAART